VEGNWQSLCNQIKNPAVVRGNFRKGSQEVTLELCMNDLNKEKQCFMRSVVGTVLGILYTLSLIFPFYSERISCLFRLHNTEFKFKPLQFFSVGPLPRHFRLYAFKPSGWDSLPDTLQQILPHHSSSSTIFPFAELFLANNIHYFPSSDQPRNRSLFLPLFPEHSVWDLSCNERKIHCNFPFTY